MNAHNEKINFTQAQIFRLHRLEKISREHLKKTHKLSDQKELALLILDTQNSNVSEVRKAFNNFYNTIDECLKNKIDTVISNEYGKHIDRNFCLTADELKEIENCRQERIISINTAMDHSRPKYLVENN